MTRLPVILLDDGGVMNDNLLRGKQWPPLIGKFFAPRLGGSATAWAKANPIVMRHILEPAYWLQRIETAHNYRDFENAYWLDWLQGMAQIVGITLPTDEECIQLAQEAESFVIPYVRSAFPGVIETIKWLYEEGYTLHTASGESSTHLGYYLEGMGVRHCFGRLYGPDLLDEFKDRPEYYSKLFADLQLEPNDALVVDDSPQALARARTFGANTVLISASNERAHETFVIPSLADLPALLHSKVLPRLSEQDASLK